MDAESRSGRGFWISVFLLVVLFSVILFPDINQEFSLSLPALTGVPGMQSLKAAVTEPLLRFSFLYVGANEYVGSNPDPQEITLDKEEFTVLLLGMVGEGHLSPFLTDSIVVIRFDLENRRVVAVSLPRDLLVKSPESRSYTKINTLYQTGLSLYPEDPPRLIRKKIEEIAAVSISRTVILDLASFTRVVDALGGITVYIEEDIDDTRFPTPEGGYTIFRIDKGWKQLDGATASQYIRTRHTPKGDIARIARQQKVAYAIQNKVSGLHPLFDLKTIFDVLTSLRGHIKTDFTPEEIAYFWHSQRDLEKENVMFRSIDAFEKDSLLVPTSLILGGEEASVLVPREGIEKYKEIQKFIHDILVVNTQ